MTKIKDLRNLNEDEFKEVYEYVKDKTNNFTSLNKSLLDENPQYLLVVRFALGLSQFEFSKLLGTTNKQWIRHFEAGRQGFRYSVMYNKALCLINKLFEENKVVSFKRSLFIWQRAKAARSKFFLTEIEPKYKIKKVSLMNIEDFEEYFNYLKKETKGFTDFNYKILMDTPQFISIFRIILDISTRQLGKLFNENSRTIRTHEYAEYKTTPETAIKYMSMFNRLFIEKNLINKIDYNLIIKNFKRISRYDELEEEILQILKLNNIDFRLHYSVTINDKDFNFDFCIFKDKEPYMILEVTKLFSNAKESTSRIRTAMKVSYLDHRFQHLKKIYPYIKTAMIIKTSKKQEGLTKRIAIRELLNTDFCLINEDINKIL